MQLKLSLIVPVYNRPGEIQELLESLTEQTYKEFEVIIVEDGSKLKCDQVCETFKDKLNLTYYFKTNSGPGDTRNYGCERANGNYCIILDSDCIIPPNYVAFVQKALNEDYIDTFGGTDGAHDSFTVLQKAINYTMTSFFTTGGIRNSEKLDKFYPRSFNMGFSKQVFETTKGFSKMRLGEDIDLSIRILAAGFKTKLIKEAFVYHKRRTSLRLFFKQMYRFGIARINLSKLHPNTLKLVHLLPAVFTVGNLFLVVMAITWSKLFLLPILLYIFLVFIDSTIKNKSLQIGLLTILTSYIQLFAYGIGFIDAFWLRIVLRKDEVSTYHHI